MVRKTFFLFFLLTILFSCGQEEPKSALVKELDEISTPADLERTLQEIHKDDQKDRGSIKSVTAQYGAHSQELADLWKSIKITDSINLIKVEYIFNKFGFPGKEGFTETARRGAFLVVHHSRKYEVMEKHFPMIYLANNNADIDDTYMWLYLMRMYEMKFGKIKDIPIQITQFEQIIDELGLERN